VRTSVRVLARGPWVASPSLCCASFLMAQLGVLYYTGPSIHHRLRQRRVHCVVLVCT
jgi:hypothetical protein